MFKKIIDTINKILSSPKFFYAVVGLLVVQAVWFALSCQYPMAFDENYHFGLIEIFSKQWSPFITESPATGVFGDVTRYDSYLFHYLMSFPYRFITLFTSNQVAQIIILRFINIGLFTAGLVVFHRLLRKIKLPEAINNFSLLILILIPVVPFLAATINYDNLTFLVVPILCILTLNCRQSISKGKLPAKDFVLLVSVGMLGSLVKYPFAPIFAAVVLYLFIVFIRRADKKQLLISLWSSFKKYGTILKLALVILLVISSGLFFERYGINLIKYHSIEPDCGAIHSVEYCKQYGPWGRDHQYAANVAENNPEAYPSVWLFVPHWIGGLTYRLFFAINYNYLNYPPLPIPITVTAIIGIFGLVLCFIFGKKLIKDNSNLALFLAVIIVYCTSLFITNFTDYLHLRKMVAINGRYLIIIMPLIFAWVGLAYQSFFKKVYQKNLRVISSITCLIVLLLFLQGGGMLTHLLRSEPDWYWQNQKLVDFNMSLKDFKKNLIIGGKDY